MFFLYQILITLLLILSPLIIGFRILKKKEDKKRYKEKLFSSSFAVRKSDKKKLIWFHVASIGEFNSIRPIIHKLHKDNKFKTVRANRGNDGKGTKLEGKQNIKKGQEITVPVSENFNCTYSVAQDTNIHPIEITALSLDVAPFGFDIPNCNIAVKSSVSSVGRAHDC